MIAEYVRNPWRMFPTVVEQRVPDPEARPDARAMRKLSRPVAGGLGDVAGEAPLPRRAVRSVIDRPLWMQML
jgi:hypothetical protein